MEFITLIRPIPMEIRHIIFFVFVASAVYVYFRGKVRFGVVRSLTDYQVLLAPVNTLLYLFSKVKPSAFISVSQFPTIKVIQDSWEMIRQEALSLQEGGSIAAATGYNDIGFNSFFELAGSVCTYVGIERRCPQLRQTVQRQWRS